MGSSRPSVTGAQTGKGQLVELALKDMALAMLGNLGIIGEVAINGVDRPKYGNSLYGAYAQDFVCKDGGRVIVVALTIRQWDNLKAATHTQAAFDELTAKLGVNLSLEGERFKHRHAITAVLKPFFDTHRIEDFAKTFDERGVTWSQYRTLQGMRRAGPRLFDRQPDVLDRRPPGHRRLPDARQPHCVLRSRARFRRASRRAWAKTPTRF